MGLPSHKRLHNAQEFHRVFREGRKYYSEQILVVWLTTEEQCTRYGIVTGKKFGNAVKRNRIKRRIREILRWVDPIIRERLHIVVVPAPSLAHQPFHSMKQTVIAAFRGGGLCRAVPSS